MQIRKEYAFGAALLVCSVAYSLFQRRPKQILKPVVATLDPSIAIRRERPMEIAPQPVSTRKFFTILDIPTVDVSTVAKAPWQDPLFGKDKERNTDEEGALDTYLSLPLEGEGKTHLNKHIFREFESEGAEESVVPPMQFTFFRLQVIKTRDSAATTAAIGGLKFMNGKHVVAHPLAKCWNPHTGERIAYRPEAAWSDSDQKEYILKFPFPVAINRYGLRTSEQDVAFDPVEWRLEGSLNGVYWFTLDERRMETMPLKRGAWMLFSAGA